MHPFPDGLELIELRLHPGAPVYAPRQLPAGKRTWSHSAQSAAERCPAAFKRRYVDRQDDPPTSPMAAGSAFGAALQHFYAGALAGQLPTPEQCLQVAASHADERAPDVAFADGETPATLRDQATEAARAYLTDRAPAVLTAIGSRLESVERRFDLRLAGLDEAGRPAECQWTIRGYLDLEASDEIRDFKLVGTTHPTQAEADRSAQGTLYLLARAAEGRPAERFVLDSTRRSHSARSRTPRFAELASTRPERALVALQERIARTTLMVALCERTGSWPHSTVGWWCAPGRCGAWDTCAGGALSAGRAFEPDLAHAA